MVKLLVHSLVQQSQRALERKWNEENTDCVFCSYLQTGVQAVSERSRIEIVVESGTLCLNISKIENCCQFQLMMDSFSKRNSYLASKFEVKKLWNSRITDFYFSSIQSKIFYQITRYLWRSKLILTPFYAFIIDLYFKFKPDGTDGTSTKIYFALPLKITEHQFKILSGIIIIIILNENFVFTVAQRKSAKIIILLKTIRESPHYSFILQSLREEVKDIN